MRVGLRGKLIASFVATLLLPVGMVLVVGLHPSAQASTYSAVRNVLALLIPFIACALVLAWIIADDILRPLRQLHDATHKITRGDFNFELSYGNNNEIDDFCAAFDLMRRRLQESLEKQVKLEEARKRLIVGVSHDLRTPMSSIKGYVEGLLDAPAYDKAKFERYLRIIKTKTDSLDRLIDELFRYTQADIDEYNVRLRRYDVRRLLERLLTPIEADEEGPPLKVHRPLPTGSIRANDRDLEQLLGNLIGNARRHGDGASPIVIKATVDAQWLRISVTNAGRPIPADEVPYIFDHFYRTEKSRSRHYGGAGLGLALCKQIVKSHGGTISVQSGADATTFAFALPMVEENTASG